MFKNVGRKIQSIVSVLFFIQFLLSCAAGFFAGKFFWEMNEALGVTMGFIVFGVSMFLCWVLLLGIYAYGKITECCEEQNKLLRILIAKQDLQQIEVKRICPNCNTELESDAIFCATCGTRYSN